MLDRSAPFFRSDTEISYRDYFELALRLRGSIVFADVLFPDAETDHLRTFLIVYGVFLRRNRKSGA